MLLKYIKINTNEEKVLDLFAFSVHPGAIPAQCLSYNCVLCKLHTLKVCQQILNCFPLITKSAQFYLAKEGCLLP